MVSPATIIPAGFHCKAEFADPGETFRRLPSKQIQYAHVRQNLSENPAPQTLTWAIYGHVADCPFAPFTKVADFH